ncbi:MAG: DinB family protein [Gemmatimonadaceae bacterium]
MPSQLQKLFHHMAWADAQVLQALHATPGSEPLALAYFAHVLGAEHVWLSRIRGVKAQLAVWPALSLEACTAIVAEHSAAFSSMVVDASGADLQRDIEYVNSAGRAFRSTLEDILIHVALHGAYHRGQVAILMRDGGGVPAPTDYIALARDAPAATRQSVAPA